MPTNYFENMYQIQRTLTKLGIKEKFRGVKFATQSLKRSTFSFFRVFTKRLLFAPCVNKAPTRRLPFAHRLCSFHFSFSPSSFIFIQKSKVKGSVFESNNNMNKERVLKDRKKLTCNIPHQRPRIIQDLKTKQVCKYK